MNYELKLKRHINIVSTLTVKRADFETIRIRLFNSYEDIREYNLRTFQRDINEIKDIFHISIQYNSLHSKYEIVNRNDTEKTITAMNVLITNVISTRYNKYILDEKLDSLGAIHLPEIIQAIELSFKLVISYEKFNDSISTERMISPLIVKENNKRWYLLAEDISKGELRVFALDRITDLAIVFEKYHNRFHKEEVKCKWLHSVGITYPKSGEQAIHVKLQFDEKLAPYVRSLPWHDSQEIVKNNEDSFIISLEVLIDDYLINKILSCVSHVKVLEPLSLQRIIKSKLISTLSNYEKL